MTIIVSLLVFLLVILVHEFGHFITAKLVGIKVNEFSIGMGPSIFNKQKAETKYSFRLLPIGGYVAMEGEDENSRDPRSYSNSPVRKRLPVILAGATMNFILAIIVLLIIGIKTGMPVNIIGGFTDNSPAKESGVKLEDKIISIDGKETNKWLEVVDSINKSSKEEVELKVLRDGETLTIKVPKNEDGKIGIVGKNVKSISNALNYAFSTFFMLIDEMFKFLGRAFTGKVALNELSGPVGVVSQIGSATKIGLMTVLLLLAFININVGFFNLLPIPALDGSKAILLIIEAIRKKPISKNIEAGINVTGFALLMLLLLFVTFKDISKLFIR